MNKNTVTKESIQNAVQNIGKKTPEQEFVDAYNKLCEEHGFTVSPAPIWVQSKDTGDWRVIIQLNIAKVE